MVDILNLVANQQRAFSPTPLHLEGILGWQNQRCQGCQGYQGARARNFWQISYIALFQPAGHILPSTLLLTPPNGFTF